MNRIYGGNIRAFWDSDQNKEFIVEEDILTKNDFDNLVDSGINAPALCNSVPAGFGHIGIIDVLLDDVRDLKKKIHKLEDELVDKMLLVNNGTDEDNSG